MVTGDFWVLFAMLLYFIVVVIIGFIYAKKSNRSTEEYFLGGRSLGPWLTALSAEASDMSGYLLMGLPGLAYFCGANEAVWTAIGLAIGTYLNWKFVAKRLRKYSEVAGNAITIPDFFSNRFHDKKNILMTIAAVIILLFFSIYVGSCFVTCGKLFATLFGLDYATMMVLGALVVFLYTFVGGYLAVSTTDLIQGSIMICALVIVFVGSVAQAGGVENTVAFLNSLPGFLNGTQQAVPIVDTSGNQLIVDGLPAFGEPTEYGIIAIISCLAWGLGYFGMVIALDENSIIFTLMSFAWAGFGATFGPLVLFFLFWKRTTRAGAIAGMIGGGMVFFWKLVLKPLGGLWGIYELLPAFLFSCLLIVVVSLLAPAPQSGNSG